MKKLLLLLIACCFAYCLEAQIYVPKKLKGKAGKYLKDMMYVPGDTIFEPRPEEELVYYPKRIVKAVTKHFYLSSYEVSNGDWKTFHKAMVAKYGRNGAYKYLPDTLSWRNVISPYSNGSFDWDWYYLHPAFANYPVVGISWAKAQEYIKWKNLQADSVLKANGITGYKVVFRLPTSLEFEFASQNSYNRHWGLLGIKGGYLANFGMLKDSTGYIFKFPWDDGWETTGPVDAYSPNDLGIWNIKGNVEEWVSDEYNLPHRNTSYDVWLSIDSTETDAKAHLVMGGSWFDVPHYLYQGVSKAYPPKACSAFTGFRLAMDIVEVKPAAGR